MRNHDTKASRKGQTLVEFAITLPVLLVLMFGIVEFGRIFQAWVSIQNAAREAARYASTNQFSDRYENLIKFNRVEDLNSIVPCSMNDLPVVTNSKPVVAGYASPTVLEYTGTRERLFATWYQGRDCNPTSEVDQDLRRDLLRLVSIYETAYLATVGRPELPALSVQDIGVMDIGENVPSPNDADFGAQVAIAENDLYNFLWSNFNPDYPQYRPVALGLADGQSAFPETEADLRSYFNVMVCSNRPFLYSNSTPIYGGYPHFAAQRFIEVVDPDPLDSKLPEELKQIVLGDPGSPGANVPGCFLNERPSGLGEEGYQYTLNPGIRWMDPGSGGSRVTVAVTYFHPLVTPLGMAQFIPISARRSAIVEDFKGAGAAAAFNPLAGEAGVGNEDEIVEIFTPTPTDESDADANPTLTPTPTFTLTPTTAPREFVCNDIVLADADFEENLSDADRKIGFLPYQVVFRIRNDNNTNAILDTVKLNWASAAYSSGTQPDPVPDYPGMFFSEFSLDGEVMWQGPDFTPATDMNDPNDGRAIRTQVFTIPANSTATFIATYDNGPLHLNDKLPRGAFGDTEFVVINPLNNEACPLGTVLFESVTQELDEDVPTPDPNAPTDCASENVDFGFGPTAFHDFGWVQLVVTNNHPTAVAPLVDFEVTWGRWLDEEFGGNVLLERIYVGGNTPNDGALLLWESTQPGGTPLTVIREGTSLVDDPGEYEPITRADGRWALGSNSWNIPPRTSRNIWLDLNGGNAAKDERKMKTYHFAGTRMMISCPNDGEGGDGNGQPPTGTVEIVDDPTPNPSPTIELNDPPRANDDSYTFSGMLDHTVDVSRGLLDNDTDCGDDTPNRAINGTVCTDPGNPSTFTNNGDEPLESIDCRNGCETTLKARIVINADGSFSYDPTGSEQLACDLTGVVTDSVNYRVRDSRGATDRGTINITIDLGSGGNRPPEPITSWSNPQTYYYDMRTRTGPIGSADNDKLSLHDLFTDPDEDDFDITWNTNKAGLTTNRSTGSWSYNPWEVSSLVDLPEGENRTIDITVTADDGDLLCGEASTRFRIVVTGQAEPPTEEPTEAPTEEEGGSGPGFGGGPG